jgi:ABC-2 type transport system permease protein
MSALPLVKIVDFTIVWWMRIVWLIVYVGLTTIVMIVATWISSKLYLRSLLNINTGSRKKKFSKSRYKREIYTKRSVFGELISTEKKNLFRSPMSVMNLVFPIIMPVVMIVILLFSISDIDQISINSALPYVDDYYTEIILIISFIFSLTSMYSAVSYSKEGNNNFTLNYLPVSFVKVFMSKVVLGTLLNLIPFACSMFAIYLIVDIDIYATLHGLVCASLAVFTVNLIGVFIDINRPKLQWNSDVEAIKNNMNVLYYMMAALLFYGLLILLSDFAGLIELLIIVMIITIVSVNENHYRDNMC